MQSELFGVNLPNRSSELANTTLLFLFRNELLCLCCFAVRLRHATPRALLGTDESSITRDDGDSLPSTLSATALMAGTHSRSAWKQNLAAQRATVFKQESGLLYPTQGNFRYCSLSPPPLPPPSHPHGPSDPPHLPPPPPRSPSHFPFRRAGSRPATYANKVK